MRITLLLLALLIFSCSPKKELQPIVINQSSNSLSQGHAHNDYEQDRPLYEALENGFTSIEIDVHSYRGKAVVCHDSEDLGSKPTLQELYLDPLSKIIAQNGGTVFPGKKEQLILMIDLKEDKDLLLDILTKDLVEYDLLIKSSLDAHEIWKPLQVIISGDPPLDKILYDKTGYFYMDGRIHHLDEDIDDYVMPRISMSYRDNFRWLPNGNLSNEELERMREMITKVHARGKKFRFWGHPETAAFWKLLDREGVDWINVDDLKTFRDYAAKQQTDN